MDLNSTAEIKSLLVPPCLVLPSDWLTAKCDSSHCCPATKSDCLSSLRMGKNHKNANIESQYRSVNKRCPPYPLTVPFHAYNWLKTFTVTVCLYDQHMVNGEEIFRNVLYFVLNVAIVALAERTASFMVATSL